MNISRRDQYVYYDHPGGCSPEKERNIVTLKNIYQLLQTRQSISFHRRQETILV